MINKNAQIWVETVIYTLIGLILIGMVLAFAIPVIEKQKDKAIIESSIDAMNQIDNNINEVYRMGPGNAREVIFLIKKGKLIIRPEEKTITFLIEKSGYSPSEIDREVEVSGTNLKINSRKSGNDYKIEIKRTYALNIILEYNRQTSATGTFNAASTPHRIIIENLGPGGTQLIPRINLYGSS